jgi:hypothetical protein
LGRSASTSSSGLFVKESWERIPAKPKGSKGRFRNLVTVHLYRDRN